MYFINGTASKFHVIREKIPNHSGKNLLTTAYSWGRILIVGNVSVRNI